MEEDEGIKTKKEADKGKVWRPEVGSDRTELSSPKLILIAELKFI